MYDRQRGAVSLMWVIAFGVITLLSVGYAFLSQQKVSELETSLATERSKSTKLNNDLTAKNQEALDLAEVVGWAGSGIGAASEPTAIRSSLEELTAVFPTAQTNKPTTLEGLKDHLITDYNASQTQIRNLTSEVEQLRNDLEARQNESRAALQEKDGTIRDLNRQLETESNNANTNISELERQRNALRSQLQDNERDISELRTRREEDLREATQEMQTLQTRNNILSERLNQVERRAGTADGSVLSVSGELMKGWIDRGRLHRIRPNMAFDVRSPLTGKSKGHIRVTAVEDRRAQFEILDQADGFDPIAEDDDIFNAVYDPERELVAVLLGSSFGQYTESDMAVELGQVGVKVQSEVGREVDYLILGTPFFDPDTGDRLEWSANDTFKAAESAAVQVLPLREAMDWLGL